MPCKHEPIFDFKMLFARKPQFICKNCGVELEMSPKLKSLSKVANIIFIAVIVFKAFSSGNSNPGGATVNGVLIEFVILLFIAAAFLGLQILLLKFGGFLEKQPKETPTPAAEQVAATFDKPQYSPEQLELVAMYEALEQKARMATEGKPTEKPAESQPVKVIPKPEVIACVHKPAENWKNYVPGRYEFTCVHCSQPIVFTAANKKTMNIIFLVVIVVFLMPTFTDQNANLMKYGLLTLLVLALGTVAQFYFLKKGHFELKDPTKK